MATIAKTELKGTITDSSVLTEWEIAVEDGKIQGLLLTFKSGRKYLYPDVTKTQLDEFKAADSKGKYFNKFIRTQKYIAK